MTDKDLAKLVQVNQNTITNWKKQKPDLYRLIRLGLSKDNLYSDFFDLFKEKSDKNIFLENSFFIDFYFRFLNYFRQNITNHKNLLHRKNNQDIKSTFIYYLIENNEPNLFDQQFKLTPHDYQKFQRESLQRPLLAVEGELEVYILKNTLDDWETLVRDVVNKEDNIKIIMTSIKISFFSLIYKTMPNLNYDEKYKEMDNLVSKVEKYQKDKNKLHKEYIKIKDKFFMDHIDAIQDLEGYEKNNFYMPLFVERLKNKI